MVDKMVLKTAEWMVGELVVKMGVDSADYLVGSMAVYLDLNLAVWTAV